MERSVKTNLTRSPSVVFNVGVRFQLSRAAWLVRVQSAMASWLPVRASAPSLRSIGRCGGLSFPVRASGVGILDDIEVNLFFRKKREPFSY
jgi:hypothetical protein